MAQIQLSLTDDDIERIARRVAELIPAGHAPAPDDGPRLYNEVEAARLLGIGVSTLKRMRLAGEVRATCARKPVRYSRADLDAAAKAMSRRG